MTTDQKDWAITGQALDHRETVAAMRESIPDWLAPDIASTSEGLDLAVSGIVTELARNGFALVRLTPVPFTSRAED